MAAPRKKQGRSKNIDPDPSPSSTRKAEPARSSPRRREIGAVICLFFGIFTCLAFFNTEAWLIQWLRTILTGFLGWGFYAVPPAFFVSAAILAFHRGRPVVLRISAVAAMPVLIGAIWHLFFAQPLLPGGLVSSFWNSGRALESGGLVSGLLANTLENMVSIVGAAIMFLLLAGYCVMLACNKGFTDIADWFKRESVPYEPRPEWEEEPVINHAPNPFEDLDQRRPRPATIDIPLDDEATRQAFAVSLGKKGKKAIPFQRPGVATPDSFLQEDDDSLAPFTKAATPNPTPLRRRVSIDIPVDGEGQVPYVEESPSVPNFVAYQTKTNPMAATSAPAPVAPPVAPPLVTDNASEKIRPGEAAAAKAEITEAIEQNMTEVVPVDYNFPPVTLLAQAKGGSIDASSEIALNAERLAATLDSFEIEANIVNATRGPSVTRYELELEPGVKLNKLTNLANDLALSLGASGVRIAPIPDKIATVGIEVPNKTVSTVYLREIIESDNFTGPPGKLTFALGKDISGNCVVGNVAKLPHLLIAGTTGSGKSVTVNGLILSILYRARPDEVKLIMIDPKMVEFGKYNGIPHLLIPVVTDPKKAAGALQWAVTEMLKRYKVFSELGAKDLESYNRTAAASEDLQPFPQLVVVIDELADLMMTAAKEVEESICRIAQMGRAAGVHLVVATQRPSANVITGLMKANIPSRIALSVSSGLDSRIIMDEQGAEKLVGNGDMLYKPIGEKPVRIQGAFVSEQEIEEVINFLKQDTSPDYDDSIGTFIDRVSSDPKQQQEAAQRDESSFDDDYDEMFGDAVNMVLDLGQASTSVLQRKLKLGYSRAGRLMDQLEEAGIVGPHMGSKPRQLLITRAQWQAMQASGEMPQVQESAFANIPKDDFSAPEDDASDEEQSYD
ncbi:MAG: DNA translocase FtsK [Oscillospiraceae bacterium]|nr:DNA translocase FtsK [Oscillospiraceae bacterium]